jgi:hypothetical protein
MSIQTTEPAGTMRTLIVLSLACAFGILAFAGAMGLTGSRLAAVIIATGIAAFVGWLFWRRRIFLLDEGAGSRALNIISGLATLAALFQLARLCVFIVNPAEVGCAIGPSRGLGQDIVRRASGLGNAQYRDIAAGPGSKTDLGDHPVASDRHRHSPRACIAEPVRLIRSFACRAPRRDVILELTVLWVKGNTAAEFVPINDGTAAFSSRNS